MLLFLAGVLIMGLFVVVDFYVGVKVGNKLTEEINLVKSQLFELSDYVNCLSKEKTSRKRKTKRK